MDADRTVLYPCSMSHMIKATALLGLLTLSTPAAAYPLTLC